MAATGPPARALVDAATARLGAVGIDAAAVDAEWLLAGLLGIGRAALALRLGAPLPDGVGDRYEAAVRRRLAREPVQRILGWESFRGLRIALSPDVLVPRPETEQLVDWVLELLPVRADGGLPDRDAGWPRRRAGGRAPVVVDVGTGSGCIACAVAHERPDARVVAIDSSLPALAVAAGNVRALGLAARVGCVAGSLVDAVGASAADLVVANLPYLPRTTLAALAPEVRDHEPRLALDGGVDGLATVGALIAAAGRVLRPGGALLLETAGAGQAHEAARRMRDAGYGTATSPGRTAGVDVRADLAGIDRFVAGRWPGPAGRAGVMGDRKAARPIEAGVVR